ncbi:MAG TPA: PDZ domain-containing protein [Phycisphaerales bacterium]|nr:PDZ domain-containing protein [Phycisphaerales bacterium]
MRAATDGPSARRITGVVLGTIAGIGLVGAMGCGGSGAGTANGRGTAASVAGARSEDPRIAELRSGVRAMVGQARDKVFPSLVNIDVVSLEYQGGKEAKMRSTGSGTIIGSDGFVLTNAHVTDRGNKFWCVLSDKQRVPATLVGEDPWTDLAVLKIDRSKLHDPSAPLPAATFGDSDRLQVGDYVLAMGSPFALSRTVTLGIVSNTERVFTSTRDAGEVDEMMLNWEQRTGLFTNWIQHDALINPGNSGGPLVNLLGQVVGVNTRGGSGMAFATPSNMARQVAESLMARGEVLRSSVGASFRQTQNTGIEEGVLVDSVETDGPAARAGLRTGDVVTAVDGAPINVRFAEEVPPLLKTIADKPIGSELRLAYVRDGKSGEAVITTEKLLKDRGEEAALRTWGLTAQRITERAAQLRKLPSTRGAIVTSLRGGGPAEQAEPKLGWGDVIRAVDGRPIDTLKDLIEQYKRIDALKDKPEHVLVEYEREGKSYLSLLKPKQDDRPDPPPELPKAWVGVATQPVVKTMAELLGNADERGFRVVRVYSGTNAARAGLKVGDVIYSIDGTRVQPRGLQDAGLLNREIRRMPIDATVTMGVYRDGVAKDLKLELERTRVSAEEVPRVRNRDFEITVREITFFDREDRRWDDSVTGVYVDSAEPAGWAGLAGIQSGDVIQKIGEDEITDPESFKRAMEKVKDTQPERVVFVVFRGVRTYFRFVEPDWKPTETKAGAAATE